MYQFLKVCGLMAGLTLITQYPRIKHVPKPWDSENPDFGALKINSFIDCDAGKIKKLTTDFADAMELAWYARLGIRIGAYGTKMQDGPAWAHYFRHKDEAGKTDDIEHASNMYEAITNNRKDTAYVFNVKCETTAEDNAKCHDGGGRSFASTDQHPRVDEPRVMTICNLYFEHDATNRNLGSRNFNNEDDGWCHENEGFDYFRVGALVLLHEMTHLDDVALNAGWGPNDDGTHGTDDYEPDDSISEGVVEEARDLAWKWNEEDIDDEIIPPWRNAESLAAAALEWYMAAKCGRPRMDIPLEPESDPDTFEL